MKKAKEYVEREAINELLERFGAGDDALALFENIPASDVAIVRHGHWIFEDDEEASWSTKVTCSACNTVVESEHRLQKYYFLEKNPYCRACGALMDEEEVVIN